MAILTEQPPFGLEVISQSYYSGLRGGILLLWYVKSESFDLISRNLSKRRLSKVEEAAILILLDLQSRQANLEIHKVNFL